MVEREGAIAYANPVAARLFGFAGPAELIGRASDALKPPESGANVELLKYRFDFRGSPVTVRALRDVSGRRLLERRLAQAESLERLGRLAGGVVHDFNNLLTAINLYADLLGNSLTQDTPQRAWVDEIRRATARGEELIGQLLRFSRRPTGKPRAVPVNLVLAGMQDMLRRLVGEDIVLLFRRSDRLEAVQADAAQLEQIVLNLAINARDAMPEGGTLTIETTRVLLDRNASRAWHSVNLRPGAYLKLTVTDSGCGMDEATRQRAFEPFFTTKQGRGTGLGLTTVHSIATQCGGAVAIDSRPGAGTSVTVLLPCAASSRRAFDAGRKTPVKRGSETILVVEDDALTRDATCRLLEACGYRVVPAANGAEALAAARHGERIHLLLTDVILPGGSGRKLAQRLRRLLPRLRVLYMSGYGPLRNEVAAVPASEMICKPFTQSALAQRVRQVLDGRGARKTVCPR